MNKNCPFCGSSTRPTWIQTFTSEPMTGCSNTDCFMFTQEIPISVWNYRPDQWINVDDNLPENGVRVLVTNGNSVCEAKYYYFSGQLCKYGWEQVDGMSLGNYAKWWMPLPEPPSRTLLAAK